MTALYFESHVTTEPIEGDRLDLLRNIAIASKFRLADLIMKKGKREDAFMTYRSDNYQNVVIRTQNLIRRLQENNFAVWRYKLESTIIDSDILDTLALGVSK